MTKQYTHAVYFWRWKRDHNGDWDCRPEEEFFFDEDMANRYAEVKKQERYIHNVSVGKLTKPIDADLFN